MTSVSTLPFSVSVQFYGAGISTPLPTPNTFKASQKEYAHDIITMEFWGGDVNSDSLASGTPVVILFGTSGSQRAFYGYVNHAGRTNNTLAGTTAVQRNATQVTCVGASWPMKQAGTQVFTSMATYQIIQSIATSFNLETDIVPDTTVWPSRAMAGQSYWQFCVGLAQLIGYTFYCNGIQLVFKPRQTNPNSLSSLAAIYDGKSDPAGLPIFSPVVGATNPTGGQLANRQSAGVNPRTLQTISAQVSGSPSPTSLGSVTVNPIFNTTEHFPVSSGSEANTKTMGSGALNQLFITATAQTVGNPQVSQGSLVYVQNSNGSQNGLWFVTEADHCINNQNYTMNLFLGRDSMGSATSINVTTQPQATPSAVLIGQTWQVGNPVTTVTLRPTPSQVQAQMPTPVSAFTYTPVTPPTPTPPSGGGGDDVLPLLIPFIPGKI